MVLLYIITGQKKEFWKAYFNNITLVYERWGLMVKRGIRLRSYYLKQYGYIVGLFLVVSHFWVVRPKVPFRYYKSFEGFVIGQGLILLLLSFISYKVYNNFHDIKFWFVSICPDTQEVIYPDYYYPYSVFLVVSFIIGIQLIGLIGSRTLRFVLMKYKYELLTLNCINIFVLITVHCTVAHEGLLYVWWMPESYEMITFTSEEELVMEYWFGELRYLYKYLMLDEFLYKLRFVYEWAYILLYKLLQI